MPSFENGDLTSGRCGWYLPARCLPPASQLLGITRRIGAGKTTRGSTFHRRKGHQPIGFLLKDAQAALCTYAPNVWEELHGLADGLRIPLERDAAQYFLRSAPITPPVRGHAQFGAVNAADILGLRVAARAQHKR
jgi:hypothetical protein